MTRAREIANVLGRNIESTTFTATAGQTAFSITHAAGRIQVYMNGLLLDPTVDWTSDGSTVTLTEGAVAGDELEVVKFDNLAVADAIPRTGHTGTIDFSDATFTPPAGYIVQHKQNTHTTYDSSTNAYTDVVTQTITPKYDNSLIIVRYTGHLYKYNTINFPNSDSRITHDQGGSYTEIVKHPYVTYNETAQYMYSLAMSAKFTVSNTNEYTIRMQINSKTYRTYIYGGSNLLTVEEIAQ